MQERCGSLDSELKQLKAQIATLEAELEEKPDYSMGTGAAGVTRWELDQVLLHRLRERLASLEQAQSRAVEGTYGICAVCGEPIHPDRLSILPDTTTCVRCARGARAG